MNRGVLVPDFTDSEVTAPHADWPRCRVQAIAREGDAPAWGFLQWSVYGMTPPPTTMKTSSPAHHRLTVVR